MHVFMNKEVLFAVAICFFELLHIESGTVLSLQYCTVRSTCPNSRILSTVVQSSIKQCSGSIYVTSSTTWPPNTEMSQPNLISMRNIRNRIGELVVWAKMSLQYRNGWGLLPISRLKVRSLSVGDLLLHFADKTVNFKTFSSETLLLQLLSIK